MRTINSIVDLDATLAAANGRPVAVLFTAPAWCQPCRALEPHWIKAQDSELLDHVTFIKVDMGETREDTGNHWASERFSIMGVPQIFLWEDRTIDDYEKVDARTVVGLIRELA